MRTFNLAVFSFFTLCSLALAGTPLSKFKGQLNCISFGMQSSTGNVVFYDATRIAITVKNNKGTIQGTSNYNPHDGSGTIPITVAGTIANVKKTASGLTVQIVLHFSDGATGKGKLKIPFSFSRAETVSFIKGSYQGLAYFMKP